MKRLNEIIQTNNNIHASIHADNVAQSTADVAGDFSSGAVFESDIDYPHDVIHDRIKGHYNKYSKSELNTIKDYSNHSKLINSYHWEKSKNPEYKPGGDTHYYNKELENQLKGSTKLMDAMVSRHKTPEDLTVYSGTKHDPRKIKKNGVVNHPAYLSTSLDPEIAESFAGRNRQTNARKKESHHHLLQIHVPKGTPGAYVAHTEKALPWERELILPRNTKLKYLKTVESELFSSPKERLNYKHFLHTHHMEVVP